MKRTLYVITGLLVAATSLWAFAWAVEPTACVDNKLSIASNQQNVPVFACWEFWLNRYQTFIAAIMAVVAAYFSVSATRQQTNVAVKANQNEASVVVYSALRAFQLQAFEETKAIYDFDGRTPLGSRVAQLPKLDLANDRRIVAHLPGNLPKKIFAFERHTSGIKGNVDTLTNNHIPLTHLYIRSFLAQKMIEAETLARDVGTIAGLYDPIIANEVWADIIQWDNEIPKAGDGSQTASWLRAEYTKRAMAPSKTG